MYQSNMYAWLLATVLFLGALIRSHSLVIHELSPGMRIRGRPFPGGSSSGFTIRPRVFNVDTGLLLDGQDSTSTTTSKPKNSPDSSEEDKLAANTGAIDTLVNDVTSIVDTTLERQSKRERVHIRRFR